MEIKLDGSSVQFDRGCVGLLALGADAVEVAAVVARSSVLISRVRWSWLLVDSR